MYFDFYSLYNYAGLYSHNNCNIAPATESTGTCSCMRVNESSLYCCLCNTIRIQSTIVSYHAFEQGKVDHSCQKICSENFTCSIKAKMSVSKLG